MVDELAPRPAPLRDVVLREDVLADVVEDPVADVPRRRTGHHHAHVVPVVRRRDAQVLRSRLTPVGMPEIVSAPVQRANLRGRDPLAPRGADTGPTRDSTTIAAAEVTILRMAIVPSCRRYRPRRLRRRGMNGRNLDNAPTRGVARAAPALRERLPRFGGGFNEKRGKFTNGLRVACYSCAIHPRPRSQRGSACARHGRARTRRCAPSGPGCRAARGGRCRPASAGSTTRCSPTGSSPSIVRRNSSGAPVDHACGLHAVGYCTGYFVSAACVAAERLGQPAVEELGRVEDAAGDAAPPRP